MTSLLLKKFFVKLSTHRIYNICWGLGCFMRRLDLYSLHSLRPVHVVLFVCQWWRTWGVLRGALHLQPGKWHVCQPVHDLVKLEMIQEALHQVQSDMEVSWNGGTPTSSIFIGFSMISQPAIEDPPWLWKSPYELGCTSWVQPDMGWDVNLRWVSHSAQLATVHCTSLCTRFSMSHNCDFATSDFVTGLPKSVAYSMLLPFTTNDPHFLRSVSSSATHNLSETKRKLRSGGWIPDRSFCCEFHGCKVCSLP